MADDVEPSQHRFDNFQFYWCESKISSNMGNNSFLSYYKTILEKVSFDNRLVEKEYWKAKQFLKSHEVQELDHWLNSTGLIHKISAAPAGTFRLPAPDRSRQYQTQAEW